MKRIGKFFGLLALVVAVGSASAQTVSVNIVRPLSNGLLAQNDLYVAATISSTYEIQSVQATIDGLTASLAYTTAAYSNCPGGVCLPQPGWSNTISLAGLTWGAKTLTVTAIDVFGNSNSAQRSIVHDLPPTLTVMAPADATVARPEVVVSATAADDDSSGTQIDVFQGGVGGPVLASGTNALNTTLNFSGADGGIVTLCFRALDSVGQAKLAYRQVYVQSSSNLVEIANVSEGRIIDAQPDRLLFQTNQNYSLPPDSWVSQALKIKSRANGVETLAFVKTNMSVGSGFLSPDGVVLVAGGSPYAGFVTGYGLFQSLGNVEILYGTHGLVPINLVRHGNFAAWGWGNALGFYPQIYLTDLQTTNTLAVTNDLGAGDVRFDLAANGDIVFAPVNGYGSHLIYRFRAGTNALLASISGDHNQSTNQLVAPKTDGSNVFYVQITPTNHMLKKISAGGEVKLTEGLTIGSDYLISNGWVAYGRNGGGQTQIWRCSPAGTNTQLTFYGTSSSLVALSAEGEVAFYNGTHLYLSKGTWPPVEITTASSSSGLTVFWQEGRWQATLGRSLFQVYSGTPQLLSPSISGNNFGLGLVGPKGRHLVIECTTNLADWHPIITNYITDGGNCQAQDPIVSNVPGKMYRLRLQ